MKNQIITKILYQGQKQIYLHSDTKGNISYKQMELVMTLLYKETGMILSKNAIRIAKNISFDVFLQNVLTVIELWKEEKGEVFDKKSAYERFPLMVVRMSDYEIIANAIFNYLSDEIDDIFGPKTTKREMVRFHILQNETVPKLEESAEILEAGTMESYCFVIESMAGVS